MKFLLLLFFSTYLLFSNAQQVCSKSFSSTVDARKMDFFFGLDYHFKIQKFNLAIGIETGIVKTAFQQRLFPGFHFQAVYPIVNTEKFKLGPALDFNGNLLQTQKSARHPNLFQEYRLGYDLKWGNKFKFIHAAGLGLIAEHYYGAYSQKYKTALAMGYSIKMGFLYEF